MNKSDLSYQAKAVAASIAENCKLPVLYVSGALNSILATDTATAIDRYMRDAFESAPTLYGRAMDAGRNYMNEYGPDHRLFDNSHSPLGAWSSVRDAVNDDAFHQEISAFLAPTGKISLLQWECRSLHWIEVVSRILRILWKISQ